VELYPHSFDTPSLQISPTRRFGREDKCRAVMFLKLGECRDYLLHCPK
jgi:hypothetical protein